MCGIAGYLTVDKFIGYNPSEVVKKMIRALVHRGPDDEGAWVDHSNCIALAHRRLSIIDLSVAGKQPMVSDNGRYVLVFNGEIYNHLKLRDDLPLRNWRGHSDTETLLAAIEQWGLNLALTKSVGMFALALWDCKLRILSLARDRMGEKPLYYGWQGSTFMFGSELKALKAHPCFKKEINRDALKLYVEHGYVPALYSIFRGIHKLEPGAVISISCKDNLEQDSSITHYWKLQDLIENRDANQYVGTPQEAVTKLEELLKESISLQSEADVPLGAFLSGGIDSSTVVAIMQSLSKNSIHTFSIGFNEIKYDESKYARKIAEHLQTQHTEFIITPQDALRIIPSLPLVYDEPFADPSQIPTILLSQLAGRFVKVSLSGDGGDELFAGYRRYQDISTLLERLKKIPKPLRVAGGKLFLHDAYRGPLSNLEPDSFYEFSNKQWKGYPDLVLGNKINSTNKQVIPKSIINLQERMMYADTIDYLPNDILVKVDRAAMSCGLETRVPLLDHRIVEFSWSLPHSIKAHSGIPKWPLKQVLYKYVPRELIDRPKMGFGIPLANWLRGPLREWAESLLDEGKLRQQGFFDPVPITKEWKLHLSGKKDRHYGIWTILMFQAWLENNY